MCDDASTGSTSPASIPNDVKSADNVGESSGSNYKRRPKPTSNNQPRSSSPSVWSIGPTSTHSAVRRNFSASRLPTTCKWNCYYSTSRTKGDNFTEIYAIQTLTFYKLISFCKEILEHSVTVCPRTKQTQILQNHDQEQLHNSLATVNLHTIVKKPPTQARDRLTLIDHSFLVSILVMKATT